MITLNILSPELKNEIKLKNIYKIVQGSLILIGIFALFYAAILIFFKLSLVSYLDGFNQKNIAPNESTNGIIQRIDQINNDIAKIKTIQEEEINWPELINKISANTPSDVSYTRITMSKTNGLSLSGQSKTRDGLMKIKTFLDDSHFLSDINFPISNLLEKENINFTITAKIINYEF